MKFLLSFFSALALATAALAHPLTFDSTINHSSAQPSGGAASSGNWTGAAFEAAARP